MGGEVSLSFPALHPGFLPEPSQDTPSRLLKLVVGGPTLQGRKRMQTLGASARLLQQELKEEDDTGL